MLYFLALCPFKSFCTIASVHAVGCLSHISEPTYRMYWRQEFCHRYNGKCYSRDLLRVKYKRIIYPFIIFHLCQVESQWQPATCPFPQPHFLDPPAGSCRLYSFGHCPDKRWDIDELVHRKLSLQFSCLLTTTVCYIACNTADTAPTGPPHTTPSR